jgi:hypothetical protein
LLPSIRVEPPKLQLTPKAGRKTERTAAKPADAVNMLKGDHKGEGGVAATTIRNDLAGQTHLHR